MVNSNLYVYDFYTLRIPTFSFNKLTKINAVLGNIKQDREYPLVGICNPVL
jgi:hypothetical protein